MQGDQPTFRDWLKAKLRDLYHSAGEPVPDVHKCPLTAPWPPGVQTRVVEHPLHGPMLQLRDRCDLPREFYTQHMAPTDDPNIYRFNGGRVAGKVN